MERMNPRTVPGAALWLPLLALGLLLALPAASRGQAPPPPMPPGQAPGAPPVPGKARAAKPAAAAPQAKTAVPVAKRRDPFLSLLVRPEEAAGGQALPPGKRGLLIPQLSVNGVVATPTERIAVVTMAGRNRAYFLRERDELYNGYVSQITQDGVVFKEKTVDAFGKQYEREVVKQLLGPGAKR